MSNRWLRFGIAFLALAAAGVAGFRIFQQEQRLAAGIDSTRSTDLAAEVALTTIPEIKAALHAYVAEGQGHAFWTARAAMLIDKLRASMLELDGRATGAGVSLTESLDVVDRLAAAEQRARDHVRAAQRLLAGEIIFTEARDLLDVLRLQVARVRTQIAAAEGARQAEIRRDQALLAVAAAGILIVALLVLVPPAGQPIVGGAPLPRGPGGEPKDEFESSARIIARTPVAPAKTAPGGSTAGTRPGGVAATAKPDPAAARPAPPVATRLPAAPPAAADTPAVKPVVPTVASETTAAVPTPPTPSLREAAAICTELGRASQSIEVSNLLARAANVLDASGAIVWMTSPDGRELYPAASAGYDERLITRIGTIPRSANNVTASAIRSGATRTSPRAAQSAAALAIPLLTPLGAVGVLSAEFKSVPEVDETRLAVATIFAAQLASLVGSRTATAGAATVSRPS